MLGIPRANPHRAGVVLLDLDVDVADGRIKCTGIGVRRSVIAGNLAIARLPAMSGTATSEKHHVFGSLLKTSGVCAQHEYRARRAKTDQPDSRPNVDGPRQPIPARWNKQNS